MKYAGLLVVAVGIALFGATFGCHYTLPGRAEEQNADPEIEKVSATGIAVVELFTSEGCSSCPPADVLLAELIKDAKDNKRPVFCLAFPVDYWNKLGWTEPYGDPNHTKRQQEYSKALRTDQIYTPQMIVNGTDGFVGSDKVKAKKSIAAALEQKATTAVTVGIEKSTGANGVTITYEIASVPKNSVLNVAVVESGLVSKVTRGENAGQTLGHDNVVRVFTTVAIERNGKGTVALKLPDGLIRKKSQVLCYVQHPDTKAIVGAAAINLDPGK